jgi:hypothetical protein
VKGDAAMLAGATADQFADYSAAHQLEIVAADPAHAVENLAKWRKDVREPARLTIKAFFTALTALSDGLKAHDEGDKADLSDKVAAIYRAIADVAATYIRLKLPLPLPNLGGSK